MKTKGLICFFLGIAAGLLGHLAARKVDEIRLLPEDWYKGDDMEHWG